MIKTSVLSREDFNALLEWFSSDREEAGEKYEKTRAGLIKFFRFRGCADEDLLADETITRVAAKLTTFDFSKNVKNISFFYGFAKNIYLEYLDEVDKHEIQLDSEAQLEAANFKFFEDTDDENFECLEKCLAELQPDENHLVLEYYSEDKIAKQELRKKLAQEMNIKLETLHTKVHRIKTLLKKCVENCLKKNNL